MRVFIPRFLGAIAYLLVLMVVGTIGYVAIEGWPWRKALYMTVITVTAVGFQEVRALSEPGRDFTMVLLAGGITGVGIWFALITSFIVEFDLGHVRRKRWRARMLEQLDGRVGILRARGLVSCLSADADNVFVCLSARDLNPDLTIVARAHEEGSMGKLYRAGADHVVSPNVNGAIRMASILLRPEVVSFLDIVTRSEGLALRFEQAVVQADSQLAGRTLIDAHIPQETGLIVIAVRKQIDQTREFVFNPEADTRLDIGDEMIVLGQPDQVDRLRNLAQA